MADINPTSMASSLATAYTQAAQDLLTTQTARAQGISTALNKLRSALSTFNTALNTLAAKEGMTRNNATFSSAVATATAGADAQAGTYSFFVDQLATTHQVAFEDLPAVPVVLGGPLGVRLEDGSTINLNLVTADSDGDGSISQSEIARAINQSPDNQGRVTAAIVTTGNGAQLVLTAGQSGQAGRISLDTSGLPAGALKTALEAPKVMVAAQDAVVWLGAQGSGIRMQQGSNTFTSIPGVSISFTRAMSAGDALATLTVTADSAGTSANVQTFVDAYNALEKALDDLTASGDSSTGIAAAAFASDAGVRSLRSRLSSILRQDFNGLSLMDFGVKTNRDGSLALDGSKLAKALTANPDGLGEVFGSNKAASSGGVLGAFSSYLDLWTDSVSGQIKSRQDAVQRTQASLTNKQTQLDDRFQRSYERYLKQFTALQALQSQMEQTSSIFDAIGSS